MRATPAIACLLLSLPTAAVAHQSPATDIYLNYEILGEESGAPWIQTIIEGSTHHFPPFQTMEAGSLPDEASAPGTHARLLDYLTSECPLSVDGIGVRPSVVSLDFTEYEVEDLLEEPFSLPLMLAAVRYELPGGTVPDEVRVRWSAFPQVPPGVTDEQMVAAGHAEFDLLLVSYEDGEGVPDFTELTPAEPELVWRPKEVAVSPITERENDPGTPDLTELQLAALVPPRELVLPRVSLVLLGGGLLLAAFRKVPWVVRWRVAFALLVAAYFFRHTAVHYYPLDPGRVADTLPDERALPLFAALQRNIYTAFDAPTEDEIYDRLSESIAAGPLLDRVYTEVYQSLLLEEAEGTRATVEALGQISPPAIGRPPGGTTLSVESHWSVLGIVAHEAHVHRRENEYRATYTLAPVGGLWKITGITQQLARRTR